MAVSIPAGGAAGVAASTASTSSIAVAVPAVAVAGDLLLIQAAAERTEVPAVTVAGSTSALTTVRTESTTNLSVRVAWKRLTADDLGSQVVVTNTAVRRQAVAVLVVRGAANPVFSNQAVQLATANNTATHTGPAMTPTAASSLFVTLWALAKTVSPYSGLTYTNTRTQRVAAVNTYSGNIGPTAVISADLLNSSSTNQSQSGDTLTQSAGSFDAAATGVVLAPAANAAPTVSAGQGRTVSAGTNVTLQGTATDSDGSIASTLWTVVSSPSTAPTITNPTSPSASVVLPAQGLYQLRFTATDSSGATASSDVTYTVTDPATATPSATASQTTPYARVDARASTSGAGGTLNYAIAPSTGVDQPTPGLFFIPQRQIPVEYTITVTEAGTGRTSTIKTIVDPATTGQLFVKALTDGVWAPASGAQTPPDTTPILAVTNAVAPTIAGTAVVGQQLTASPGVWSPSTDQPYGYQWNRDSTPISGATSSTYTPVTADVGKRVTVTVTAPKTGYRSGTQTSTGLLVAAETTGATETFTGTDGAAWSSSWASTGGSYTIQGNKGKQVTPTGAYAQTRADLTGLTKSGDTNVVGTFSLDNTGEQYIALSVCSDGQGTGIYNAVNSYTLLISAAAGQAQLVSRIGGTQTNAAQVGNLTFTPGTLYRARLNRVGSTLQFRIWDSSTAEPSTWLGTWTDASLANGWVSVGAMNGSDGTSHTVTWDDISVSSTSSPIVVTQPPSTGGGTGGGTGTGTGSTTPVTGYNAAGDSMTAVGGQDGSGVSYPSALAQMLGTTVVNDGRGGWTSTEIAILEGGINPVLNGFTMPADQSEVTVTLQSPTDRFTQWAGATGVINGIACNLTHYMNTDGHWAVRRLSNGAATAIPSGSKFHGTQHDADRDKCTLILVGRNNVTYPDIVRRDIAGIVANLTTTNYLVMSIMTGNDGKRGSSDWNAVTALNSSLASIYGDRYVDVRRWVIDNGMAYNGLTPTSADNTNIAADTLPPSLLWNADLFHPNQYGYKAMARAVYLKLQAMNMLPGATGTGSGTVATPAMTRSGKTLQVGGTAKRFSGANAYWVGLNDNAGGVTFPSQASIASAFAGMKTMGVSLVRAHTVGISTGTSKSYETAAGVYSDANLDAADYAVYQAKLKGIYLMVPLTDNWNYYHGGKWNFVHWAYQQNPTGLTDVTGGTKDDVNERVFFANTAPGLRVRALFKDYISHWLKHVNPYTGLAYKDDPTIAIIETGNEIYYASQLGTNEWTQDIASYIKGIAPNKLVADGSAADRVAVANQPGLTASAVDIVGAHYYPQQQSGAYPPVEFTNSSAGYPAGTALQQLAADATAAANASKAFIVGEYPWTRSSVSNWYTAIEGNADIDGDMFWAFIAGTETHGTGQGTDDAALHYPYLSGYESSLAPALATHIGNANSPSTGGTGGGTTTGNVYTNGDFETAGAEFSMSPGGTMARSTSAAHAGTNGVRSTFTAGASGTAWNFVARPASPSGAYNTSIWMRTSKTVNLQTSILYLDGNGNYISGYYPANQATCPAGTWQQFQATAGPTIPAGTAAIVLRVYNDSLTWTAGDIVDFDDAQITGATTTGGSSGGSTGGGTTTPPVTDPNVLWGGKALYRNPANWSGSSIPANDPDKTLMTKMIAQPTCTWITDNAGNGPSQVRSIVNAANANGQIALLALYYIMRRDCGAYSSGGAADEASYKAWVDAIVTQLGTDKAIFIIEPDALHVVDCLSSTEQTTRWRCIKYAVDRLAAQGSYTYIEAGTWGMDVSSISSRLQASGIAGATGFAANVSQYVEDEGNVTGQGTLPWCEQISALCGGKPYVNDTGRNGVKMIGTGANGTTPWDDWCNPYNRGLGVKPLGTINQTKYPHYQAALWIKGPGGSDGPCNGCGDAGSWCQSSALSLAQHANPAL